MNGFDPTNSAHPDTQAAADSSVAIAAGSVQPQTSAAGQAAAGRGASEQVFTAEGSNSGPPTRIWLPRPEPTYRTTSVAADPARTGPMERAGPAVPAEPLTAKVAADRMRASLRRGNPIRALESFDPTAKVGLSCTCCRLP